MRFFAICLCFVLSSIQLLSQETITPLVPPNELETSLKNIEGQLYTVSLEKVEYEQDLRFDGEDPYLVTLEIRTRKGKKASNDSYRFNLANIDQDRIEYSEKKTHFELKLTCVDKQKFIQPFKDGKQANYTHTMTLYARSADEARALQSTFRTAIPKARSLVQETVNLASMENGMDWLAAQLDDIKVGKNFFSQSFERSEAISTQVRFLLDDEITIVNLIDLNPNSVAIDVQGKKLMVVGQTDDKVDFITHEKKGALKGYSNKFALMVETVEEGKLTVDVLQKMIPWAREEFRQYVPVVNDRAEGLALLKEYVGTALEGGSNKVGQTIEASCITLLTQVKSGKKESVTHETKFNLDDLDNQNLDVSISGKTITVDLQTKSKLNLIQSFANEQFDKYSNKHSIYASDVENARYLQQLIPKVIGTCKSDIALKGALDESAYFDWIQENTADLQTPAASYEQQLSQSSENSCEWTLQQTVGKAKKTVVHEYTFALKDLDPEKIDFDISSKELAIKVGTSKRKKAIQHTQDDGKGSAEVNSFLLLMNDIEKARQMKKSLKAAIQSCGG
ncbi:MAG: hypothetical protein HRU41_04775 [Saprospiraceae bacterium]|nr:hypothetical protein [Saprospiraceae bacterium]